MYKHLILILLSAILFQACSSDKPVESFLKTEVFTNKEKNIKSLLFDKKNSNGYVLDIYSGKEITAKGVKAKSFKQKNYDYLMRMYYNDTVTTYWSNEERKQFSFSELVLTNEWMKRMLTQKDSVKYLYNVSAPLFTKDKSQSLFSVIISSPPAVLVDEYVVIMKKEKGKWVLLEKVYSNNHYSGNSN